MNDEYEFKVVKVRSIFQPRWWQLRRRYYRWRRKRELAKMRKRWGPELCALKDEMDQEIERKLLFGDNDV